MSTATIYPHPSKSGKWCFTTTGKPWSIEDASCAATFDTVTEAAKRAKVHGHNVSLSPEALADNSNWPIPVSDTRTVICDVHICSDGHKFSLEIDAVAHQRRLDHEAKQAKQVVSTVYVVTDANVAIYIGTSSDTATNIATNRREAYKPAFQFHVKLYQATEVEF